METALLLTGTKDSSIRVLLVEDNPESAELVRIYLREDAHQGFRVEWCAHLSDAMSRLNQPGFDVVLLDLGMPELTGYKSYRAVEAVAGRSFPIVILTADEREMSRDLTLGFGAAGYLVKHRTSPAELRKALRDAVGQGRE